MEKHINIFFSHRSFLRNALQVLEHMNKSVAYTYIIYSNRALKILNVIFNIKTVVEYKTKLRCHDKKKIRQYAQFDSCKKNKWELLK